MKSLRDLTERQLAILAVLWERGEVSANALHKALADQGWARGTLGAMLHRLERQGVLAHRRDGREYLYRALASRDEVAEAQLTSVRKSLFGDDAAALLRFAVSRSEVREGDAEKLRDMLARFEEGDS
jgi:predicted transcriptional regulator